MRYDPTLAAINLAAQLVVYHGHELEDIADITTVREHKDEVMAEIDRLRAKSREEPTKRHFVYRTSEINRRKLRGLIT